MFRRFQVLVVLLGAVVVFSMGGSAALASAGSETDVVVQRGQTSLFFAPSATTTIQVHELWGDLRAVAVDVYAGNAVYSVWLGAPQGQVLTPGDYTDTERNPGSSAPLLDVGYNGSDCGGPGQFRIQTLTVDGQGTVTSFAATFELNCGPYVFGQIRYNVPGDGGGVSVGPQDMWWPAEETDAAAISAPVTVSNPGPAAVTMGASSLTGPDAADDTIASDGCAGTTLQSGDTCQISVSYKPLAGGDNQATLNVPEQGGATHTVLLHGTVSVGQTSGTIVSTSDAPSTKDYFFKAGDISLESYASGRSGVTVFANNGTDGIQLVFGAAPGQPFVAGEYDNARQGSSVDTQPYIAIQAEGGACPSPTGNFDVREVTVEPNGIISSLWITFEQACGGGPATLTGEIRYNEPGDGGAAGVSPMAITWPDAQPDSLPLTVPVTVWNPGSAPVQFGAASISGPDAADDTIASDTCAGQTLATGDTCTVSVTYQPLAAGTNQATLAIPEQGGTTHSIPLAGFVDSGRTEYALQSDPGDEVGQGLTYDYVPSNAQISAQLVPTSSPRTILATYWTGTDGNTWTAQFSPPVGEQLTVGSTYTDTTFGASPDDKATINVTGPYGCNATGTFTITDLAVDQFGNLLRLGVEFVQYCHGTADDPLSGPALHGTLNFRVNYLDASTKATTEHLSGAVSPNEPGKPVTVQLQRKTKGKWRTTGKKHLKLGKASNYQTTFARPKAKQCRAIATFSSSNKQLASRTVTQFGC